MREHFPEHMRPLDMRAYINRLLEEAAWESEHVDIFLEEDAQIELLTSDTKEIS